MMDKMDLFKPLLVLMSCNAKAMLLMHVLGGLLRLMILEYCNVSQERFCVCAAPTPH